MLGVRHGQMPGLPSWPVERSTFCERFHSIVLKLASWHPSWSKIPRFTPLVRRSQLMSIRSSTRSTWLG